MIVDQFDTDRQYEGSSLRSFEGTEMSSNMHRYDSDVIAWANEQARLLREGQFSKLDIEHIAEEIEDVGKSEQRELANRLVKLLSHLLKWQFQPSRKGSSWEITIRNQRRAIHRT